MNNLTGQTIQDIPLRKINLHDNTFRISYPSTDTVLFSSVGTMGIIEPVVLLEGTPLVIVTGFRRVEAAKKLGFKKIPAIIVELSEQEALLFYVHDNVHRGLNIVEKAHALEKMVRMDTPKADIYALMMMLSLGPHEKVLANFLSIAGAEETLKRFIIEQALSMKNIEYMLRFGREEREIIMKILTPMRCTDSYIREILEMLHLIKIRKGKFAKGILRKTENAQELRAGLKKIVHPKLTSLEKKLMEIKSAAALPPALDIKVDPFFEKEYIDITIRTKSEKEIKELLGKLDDILEKGQIRSILELTKGRVC